MVNIGSSLSPDYPFLNQLTVDFINNLEVKHIYSQKRGKKIQD